MRQFLLSVFVALVSFFINAQESKTIRATRITNAPKIDGILDDTVWKNLPTYNQFYMLEPSNEGLAAPEVQTEIKLAYDDLAVYVAAYMYDDQPELIPMQFSQRDEVFVQADQFMVALNTYNDGINETRFWVTSAGTIGDSRLTLNNQDFGFNVVFQCRVSLDDKGWYAEFKIPYNTLRFPEIDVQDWSINFFRRLVRQNETHSFNRVNKSIGREAQYSAPVTGVRDIDPPVRLTFFPFAQASQTIFDGESTTEFSGGMDVKYGLSDSFTLDAQLIPDFGQVAFDAVRLNLGPFEQTFSENRAFFTEGIDLFNKGRIFFSRRIGGAPTGRIDLNDNETITNSPSKVNLINSIKVSGRTKNNLGVGILNSITEQTFATVEDSETGTMREAEIEPLTNYNVVVLDQQFNQNSSVSLINTNVTRNGSNNRDANVSGLVFSLANKENSFLASGRTIVSNVNGLEGLKTGFSSEFDFFRTKGNFRYRFGHDFANTTYDINDLGLNFRNNFNSFAAGSSYETFEPVGVFNRLRFSITGRHRRLYRPDVETGTSFDFDTFFALKTRDAFGIDFDYDSPENDYFEPRSPGRFVIYDEKYGASGFISTDYRRRLAIDIRGGFQDWVDVDDQFFYRLNISPRYRFSEKLLLILESSYRNNTNNFGWVDSSDTEIFFGRRDITSLENTLSIAYNFDPYKAINLRFRNFWSTADYSDDTFFTLNEDGTRTPTNYDLAERRDPNTNFNIWNLDLSFRWRFAPGSEASLLYRNQIFNQDELSQLGYSESLDSLFDQPIQHTVSLRVTYFIDYNNIKGIFNKTES
ncbi:hydrolase [Dokdonia sinensis]|uniref:Hydrolase n=1 Tax=Dokdonia sinensis TaxID=2479847 RepID=A0A3M0GAN6_9FLAO|nr:DUF5916 domain-containing protein [Dokdonia sinensis]RMB59542.1 hydrolase [Dokdonia sinensis]